MEQSGVGGAGCVGGAGWGGWSGVGWVEQGGVGGARSGGWSGVVQSRARWAERDEASGMRRAG